VLEGEKMGRFPGVNKITLKESGHSREKEEEKRHYELG